MKHIAEFFRYMSQNNQHRFYYMAPLLPYLPYAYQHSSIRDVATVCNLLDLIQLLNLKENVFDQVIQNTLNAYNILYQEDEFHNLPDGNIGDIGFFLLALEKCFHTLPHLLPQDWNTTKARLIARLLTRQNSDGSLPLYFDPSLYYEKNGEAFYLPEALIGLISCLKQEDQQAFLSVQKAILYCCQDKNRDINFRAETATFYANWQFQLFYHWLKKNKSLSDVEKHHCKKLWQDLKESKIAHNSFGSGVATVEVACYLEGLAHAKSIFSPCPDVPWLEKEIDRCLVFLHTVQHERLDTVLGGFVHSLNDYEARIDVAGHVFNSLFILSSYE